MKAKNGAKPTTGHTQYLVATNKDKYKFPMPSGTT